MNSHIKWLYGIDGCHRGWAAAKSGTDLGSIEVAFVADLGSLFAEAEADSVIAIDIPIGLPDNAPRACDTQARELLGWPRRNSVFSPPSRHASGATSYPEALRLNREALDTGISKQAFCIMPKIREVDDLMSAVRQRYIREAHPEVTFAQLNAGPMLHNKKTAAGRGERITVLNKAGVEISDEWLAHNRAELPPGTAAVDDLVDALACLITALHVQTRRSQSLGRNEQRDAKGLLMEIVTCARTAKGASA